jgi:hypothetical protein
MGEKSSRAARPYSQMRAFQCALNDSGLADLGFKGPKFLGVMVEVDERIIRNGLTEL